MMPKAESVIAIGLMGLSVYLMIHALALPILWVEGAGPGGGAFPFWLSLLMFLASFVVYWRSRDRPRALEPFVDPDMLWPLVRVVVALVITIALLPIAGTYVAVPLFMVWYLRVFGRNSWTLTAILTVGTALVLFFFFEVTLRILLPKGLTEPLFLPLYQLFF